MNVFHSLVNAILVIVLIYASAIYMRRKGVLTEDHSLTLARIVTDLCLPAVIFVSLAGQSITLGSTGAGPGDAGPGANLYRHCLGNCRVA